jgi:hypothetical protein
MKPSCRFAPRIANSTAAGPRSLPVAGCWSCSHPRQTAAPEALLIGYGFAIDLLVDLIRAGLARATSERVRAGRETIEVARVKITEAGRRALAASAS